MESSLELIGKFIGPWEITSTRLVDGTSDLYEVEFQGGRRFVYTAATLPLVVTDTVSDLTTVQEKKLTAAVGEIMLIIEKYNLDYGELEMFVKKLLDQISNTFNRALSLLWFKNEKEYVPGFDPMHYASYMMAKNVIAENEKSNN